VRCRHAPAQARQQLLPNLDTLEAAVLKLELEDGLALGGLLRVAADDAVGRVGTECPDEVLDGILLQPVVGVDEHDVVARAREVV